MTLSKIARRFFFFNFFFLLLLCLQLAAAERRSDFILSIQKCVSLRKLFEYFLPVDKSFSFRKIKFNWNGFYNMCHLILRIDIGIALTLFTPSGTQFVDSYVGYENSWTRRRNKNMRSKHVPPPPKTDQTRTWCLLAFGFHLDECHRINMDQQSNFWHKN